MVPNLPGFRNIFIFLFNLWNRWFVLNYNPIKKALSDEMNNVNESLKISFSKIKEEMDDHLQSINENTGEIQSNHDYLCEVDNKVNKLNQRLDEIEMFIRQASGEQEKIKLTLREQEVFLALYTSEDLLTYRDIAKKLGFTESLVGKYIKDIIKKGVPLLKLYEKNKVYLQIDDKFRDLQAKNNILDISETVLKQFTEF